MEIIYHKHSMDSYGEIKLEIHAESSKLSTFTNNEVISEATYKACAILEEAILSQVYSQDKDAIEQPKQNRKNILGLFDETTIFVEEIPNGYCSSYCCKHLPWFIITTSIGKFTVGWRKRVISIDWSQTKGTNTAEALFPSENVTKSGKSIHAWSHEDAKRYIDLIFKTAESLIL